jgi:hypothetical protein
VVEYLVRLWLRDGEVEDEFRRVFVHVRDAWSHM